MPQVAEDPHFKGQIKDINPKFIEYLKEFVSLNLAPENIIPKLMNGQPIHCEDLIQYFNSYMKIFKSDEMPEPKSVFEATAEANHLSALNFANDTYIEAMEAFFGADKSYFDKEALEKEHDKIKEQAMKVFDSRGKMGSEEFSQRYHKKLEADIDKSYIHYKRLNESKKILHDETKNFMKDTVIGAGTAVLAAVGAGAAAVAGGGIAALAVGAGAVAVGATAPVTAITAATIAVVAGAATGYSYLKCFFRRN